MNEMDRPWRLCLCLWLCIHLTLTSVRAKDTRITVVNKCSYPVWPGITNTFNESGTDVPEGFKTHLHPRESYSINFPLGWAGSIWGRFGCSFDKSGRGSCLSGDCGGLLRCDDYPSTPFTQVELYGSPIDLSNSVSFELGYNMPMSIKSCEYQECTPPVEKVCPKNLQLKVNNQVVACNGKCDLYLSRCDPPEFHSAFKKACPHAQPFVFEASCPQSTNYVITYCPSQ